MAPDYNRPGLIRVNPVLTVRTICVSESAEAYWAVSLPRTLCGPLTKATHRDSRSVDLKSQIELSRFIYLTSPRVRRSPPMRRMLLRTQPGPPPGYPDLSVDLQFGLNAFAAFVF